MMAKDDGACGKGRLLMAMNGEGITVFCFLASYVLAFALEWARLVRGGMKWARPLTLVATSAGLVAHTWYLYNRSVQASLPPLLSSSHDWFLVLAWMVVLFYLVLIIVDGELAVGLFALPLVLILIATAYFVRHQPTVLLAEDLDARRGWAMLHATLLVFGIAGVMIGFILSLMYLVQHYRLKHKHGAQEGMALPSLERLSRLNWWAVILTVPLLTLGLLTGVILGLQARKGPTPFSFRDPVVVGNGIVWLVMVAFFIWRLRTAQVSGKLVAWRTLWAFGFLLVTLIGLQILSGGTLSFHSFH